MGVQGGRQAGLQEHPLSVGIIACIRNDIGIKALKRATYPLIQACSSSSSSWAFDSVIAPVIDAAASLAVGNSISFDRRRLRQVRVLQLPCTALTNDMLEHCSSRSIRPLGRAAARARAAATSSTEIVESAHGPRLLSSTCLSVCSSTACLDIQCSMFPGDPGALDMLSSMDPAQLSRTTSAAALLVQRSRLMVDHGSWQRLKTKGRTASPAVE